MQTAPKVRVALLRGINVGGTNKLPMKELRTLCERTLGWSRVETLIQSGNLIFESHESAREGAQALRTLLSRTYNYDVPTLVLDAPEFLHILSRPPFDEAEEAHLHYTLLHGPPSREPQRLLDIQDPRASLHLGDRCVYLHCPQGYGRIKLNNTRIEKELGVPCTTRSLKTMRKIAAALRARLTEPAH